jgi:7-keto-8-aminopelargonate synthetase-like enzyme
MPRFPVSGATATHVTINGRDVLSFGGCNYLGLAQHPEVINAAARAMARFGLSTSASRETTGNTTAHDELEAALIRFLGMPTAVVVPDGYTANLAIAQALAADHRVGIIDRRSHKSIREAVAVSGMELVEFDHQSPGSAAEQIARHAPRGVAVFTDGVFTADGGLAPVPELLATLPSRGAVLIVDDCHGFCVLGPRGAGTVSHFGVADPRLAITTTLAKGLGCHGGVVAGAPWIAERVRTRASAYICTTPTSPAIAAAAAEAVGVVQREPERLARLRDNAQRLSSGLSRLGIDIVRTPAPICAFVLNTAEQMRQIHTDLLAEGILAPLISYPGGPASTYFRLSVTCEHRPEQIDRLLASLGARLYTAAVA